MDLAAIIARMNAHARAIQVMLEGLDESIAHTRPDADRWSIVEIIGHLADEEREDFRRRLELTLYHPDEPWPPLDPQGRVTSLGFNSRTLDDVLGDFLSERERSLAWLASIQEPDWDRAREHPVAGSLSAGDLLASWVAHDLLHIRQLARTLWEHLPMIAPGRDVGYAGPPPQ